MTKNIVVLALSILSLSMGFAQNMKYQSLLSDVEWGEGTIILTNGTELNGLINYNDKKGIVSFESGKESRTLIARQVLGFEYYDQRVDRKRMFYSLECTDDYAENNGPFVFEVIKEFKTFAVLYKADPVEFQQKSSWTNYKTPGTSPGTYNRSTIQNDYVKITQRETIYLFPADGKVTPLLEMSFRQSEGRLIEQKRTKHKLVNKDVLISCTGSLYPELEAYAKSNNLDLDEKDDLLKVFDYYEERILAEQ